MKMGVSKLTSVLLGVALLVGATPLASAQDPKDPRGFFEEGFVFEERKPGESGLDPNEEMGAVPKGSRTGTTVDEGTEWMRTFESKTPKPSEEPRPVFPEHAIAGTLKVESLDAIINAEDEEHFYDSLQELADTVESSGVSLGMIYAIGRFPDPKVFGFSPIAKTLAVLGANIQFLPELPEDYPIELSPTWVVHVEPGTILIEAPKILSAYFSSNGEYLDIKGGRLTPVLRPAPEEAQDTRLDSGSSDPVKAAIERARGAGSGAR